jgi:pimeloyl-ACP methyl ester carboxylesterase
MTTPAFLATIVLIHGLGTDRHAWDAITPQLAPHRVLAVELPGHGANLPAPATLTLDVAARQIAARMRAEHAAPAIVVGHSLGGAVAARLAQLEPTLVSALVVVDMPLGPTWGNNEIADMRGRLAKDRPAALRAWFGPESKSAAQLERLLVGLRPLSNAALIAWAEAMAPGAVPDGGAALAMPVLLMATRALLPGQKPRAAELADIGFGRVRHLEVELFPDSKHWLMWDEPDHFVRALRRFAGEVSGTSAAGPAGRAGAKP